MFATEGLEFEWLSRTRPLPWQFEGHCSSQTNQGGRSRWRGSALRISILWLKIDLRSRKNPRSFLRGSHFSSRLKPFGGPFAVFVIRRTLGR